MEQTVSLPVTGFEPTFAALRPGLELLALPACVIDRQLRYHYVNPAYTVHFGKGVEEFVGRTADEVFRQKPSDDRRTRMEQALAGDVVVFNRRTLEGPNAGQWVRAHYLPLRESGGSIVGVVVVLVDVQPLKDAEARLDYFLENMPG